MISANLLRERLQQRPFRPLKVCLADGSQHVVQKPDVACLFGSRLFVGIRGADSLSDKSAVKELHLMHITRIEDV